jgi:hypothetical protein
MEMCVLWRIFLVKRVFRSTDNHTMYATLFYPRLMQSLSRNIGIDEFSDLNTPWIHKILILGMVSHDW